MLTLCLSVQAREYIARDGHDMRGFGTRAYSLTFMTEYNYNQAWLHYASFDLKALMPINEHFEMEAKLQAQTSNVYTAAVALRPTFDLPVGQLYLETELMYKGVARSRMHDYAASFSAGYRMDYVQAQFGMLLRVMDSWDRSWGSSEQPVLEPINLKFRVEVFARPQTCNWNISAALTNYDDFRMERLWQPFFVLNGRYDVTNHWRIEAGAECELNGMFHLNAGFHGAMARAGFTYRF